MAKDKLPQYQYKTFVNEVIDGDTFDCTVDLGFKVFRKERIRMFGINTPESRTKDKVEKELGLKAKAYLKEKIEGVDVVMEVIKQEKFGRYMAIVYIGGVSLNDEMVRLKYARAYFGEKRGAWIV